MRTVVGFHQSFSSAEKLNWPSDILFVLSEQKIYFSLEDSTLDLLRIKEHVKSRGDAIFMSHYTFIVVL